MLPAIYGKSHRIICEQRKKTTGHGDDVVHSTQYADAAETTTKACRIKPEIVVGVIVVVVIIILLIPRWKSRYGDGVLV